MRVPGADVEDLKEVAEAPTSVVSEHTDIASVKTSDCEDLGQYK